MKIGVRAEAILIEALMRNFSNKQNCHDGDV